jgi:hypothetical protein
MAARRQGPREAAVRKDLTARGDLLGVEALAASAVELAKSLDAGGLQPGDVARLSAELRTTLRELAKAAPAASVTDGLDELQKRRDQRRRQA